jgi:single-strand DNA-binding protein
VAPVEGETAEVNRVELEGRLAAEAETRCLPSGDEIVTFRVVVRRPPGGASRAQVDTLDCVVRRPGLCRRVQAWPAGSQVAVTGALRRRFWRGGAGVTSRTEVEVERARLVRRVGGTPPVRD